MHAKRNSKAAARTDELAPSCSGVHAPLPAQSARVVQIEWLGGGQLLVQNVVAKAPPSGASTKVPQHTSPALQEPEEHSNCVRLVHALKSRHAPEKPERQHVCPRGHSVRPNGLHELAALPAGAPSRALAASFFNALSLRPPSPVGAPLFDDEPHATTSGVLKMTRIKSNGGCTKK
jgi:hypothetical protein